MFEELAFYWLMGDPMKIMKTAFALERCHLMLKNFSDKLV